MAEGDRLPWVVFDAFALMAYVRREAAGETVAAFLREAQSGALAVAMCVVNVGEVLYNHAHRHGAAAAELVLGLLGTLPIRVIAADLPLTQAAAALKASVKGSGRSISYADCFAAALAQQLDGTLVTGDREFEAVEDVVRVEWLDATRR